MAMEVFYSQNTFASERHQKNKNT